MLSEILKKKGYRLFRDYPFIDREEEIKFLKEFFEDKPSRILFLYGPKSTGKTTLIEYIIENKLFDDFKLFKSNKYNIKYINFRRKLIANYDMFIDSLVTKENKNLDEKLSASINLGVFKLNSEVFESIKTKQVDLFDALTNEFQKSKKQNIFIIDEIQVLEDIYIDKEKELLKEFLNFCVSLTKETHLSHVVILTSNTIFLNRLYNDAKLKATSIFKLIDHPDIKVARKLLEDLEYNNEQIGLILEYFGNAISYLLYTYMMIKPNEPIEKLEEFLEKEKLNAYMQIDEIFTRYKKYKLTEDVSELFLIIAKEIVKQGKFNLKEQDTKLKAKLIDVIDVFCEKEILFFDPQTGIITPNSRIYLKAMEELVDGD
jgi:AAA+ ATPase superfamily predicted ATPase